VKLVLVIWHDAHMGNHTWEHLRDMEDDGPYVVRSVGYLIPIKNGGKKKHISIAQSWSEAECVDSVLHIPTAMIQSVIDLSETKCPSPEPKSSQYSITSDASILVDTTTRPNYYD
jgi:hypothetical protein